METFYTYHEELNTVQKYDRHDLIDRINDYVLNFEDKDNQECCLIKDEDTDEYTYQDLQYKLGNTYSAEHLFMVLDDNGNALFRDSKELNQ